MSIVSNHDYMAATYRTNIARKIVKFLFGERIERLQQARDDLIIRVSTELGNDLEASGIAYNGENYFLRFSTGNGRLNTIKTKENRVAMQELVEQFEAVHNEYRPVSEFLSVLVGWSGNPHTLAQILPAKIKEEVLDNLTYAPVDLAPEDRTQEEINKFKEAHRKYLEMIQSVLFVNFLKI